MPQIKANPLLKIGNFKKNEAAVLLARFWQLDLHLSNTLK